MITVYEPAGTLLIRRTVVPGDPFPESAVWIDILAPSPDERRYVDAHLALELPVREEMQEIESSSRLYTEGGAAYMTATIITHADDPNPNADVITFVLSRSRVVTLRYVDPKPIAAFVGRAAKKPDLVASGEQATVGLLESFVDRIADILEKLGLELDAVSREIFDEARDHPRRRKDNDLRSVLRRLGRADDLASTARESLLSITRVVRYLATACDAADRKDLRGRLKDLRSDVTSLSEHAAFEANKVQFLLDATLGMINIEQNAIIKIFSVAAVVFLPPTLVASIYGMNFRHLPELEWPAGYPVALVLMVVSAIVPYLYFKRKGWL